MTDPPALPVPSEGNDLYIMRNPRIQEEEFKIGRSNNAELRRLGLSPQQNFDMQLLAIFFGLGLLEKKVHATLESKRSQEGLGKEWFKAPLEDVVEAVRQTAQDNEQSVGHCFMYIQLNNLAGTH